MLDWGSGQLFPVLAPASTQVGEATKDLRSDQKCGCTPSALGTYENEVLMSHGTHHEDT